MRLLTKKQQQWMWFLILWCGGLAAAVLLAYLARLIIGIAKV
jgi:hypothetical protein